MPALQLESCTGMIEILSSSQELPIGNIEMPAFVLGVALNAAFFQVGMHTLTVADGFFQIFVAIQAFLIQYSAAQLVAFYTSVAAVPFGMGLVQRSGRYPKIFLSLRSSKRC